MKMKIDQNSLVVYLTGYIQKMFKDIECVYLSHSDWERDLSRLSYELGRRSSRVLTIDLPALGKHLDRCLDQGQYTPSAFFLGRLQSRRVKVPVFLRDLYLQIFDLEGKLRDTPDLEAVYCLRTLFMAAKKLRLPFTKRSVTNEIANFIRIETEIDRPHLNWGGDDLYGNDASEPPNMFCRGPRSVQDRNKGQPCQTRDLFSAPTPSRGEESDGESSDCAELSEPILGRESAIRLDGQLRHVRQRSLRAPSLRPRSDRQSSLFCVEPGRRRDSPVIDRANEPPIGIGLALLHTIADRVSAQLGPLGDERNELPKHGPGAVSDPERGGSKYLFRSWSEKLQAQFPADLYGDFRIGASHDLQCHGGYRELVNHEPPSRLIAVPKTQKAPRLIAAESTSYQWIQQLIKSQLEGRSRSTCLRNCISFRDQRRNGRWALRGSIDGCFATIDLSSASDRLSARVVESLFRSNSTLLERLHASRTRWMTYDRGIGKEYLLLNKFSTMGSAVTFPVQSIIYAYVAIAAVHFARGLKVTSDSIESASRQVRVYGDDIIVPADTCQVTMRLLTELGLVVNADKTFFTGRFRESCGVDAWMGHDVTPPYLLGGRMASHLNHLESLVKVSNNFHRKGFWHVAEWLRDQAVGVNKSIPVVPTGSGTFGFTSFCGADHSTLKKRWNEGLHRDECRAIVPYSKTAVAEADGYVLLFQWLMNSQRASPPTWVDRLWPKVRKDLGPVVRTVSGMRPRWIPLHIIS